MRRWFRSSCEGTLLGTSRFLHHSGDVEVVALGVGCDNDESGGIELLGRNDPWYQKYRESQRELGRVLTEILLFAKILHEGPSRKN
ncbi:MAG: hypothetical protein UT02_C0003G0012 [Parcubacteria group bacterium GW2011_GWC2_38_7]|nr:MAG: hypothetical protein UT02_C0003G0012 [Parcubacteria group bacterium GW2011_GWC2_38_7]